MSIICALLWYFIFSSIHLLLICFKKVNHFPTHSVLSHKYEKFFLILTHFVCYMAKIKNCLHLRVEYLLGRTWGWWALFKFLLPCHHLIYCNSWVCVCVILGLCFNVCYVVCENLLCYSVCNYLLFYFVSVWVFVFNCVMF